jgi:hypothetical protein
VLRVGNWRFGRESGSPGFRDPNANDLHSLAARLDGLSLCCFEPGTDDAGEHFERESVRARQCLGEAALVDREQF